MWPNYIIYHPDTATVKILKLKTHDKDYPRYEPYLDVETGFVAACDLVKQLNEQE